MATLEVLIISLKARVHLSLDLAAVVVDDDDGDCVIKWWWFICICTSSISAGVVFSFL